MDQSAAWKVFMIFIVKNHSNKNNEYKTKANSSVRHKTAKKARKQLPTKHRWETGMKKAVWFPIRENDRQLLLTGNHTGQKQIENIEIKKLECPL